MHIRHTLGTPRIVINAADVIGDTGIVFIGVGPLLVDIALFFGAGNNDSATEAIERVIR
jgi:hypothetical protein